MGNHITDLVTIITPNYNSEKYIKDTFNSILQQTHENWEWLIIDDGSTDDSPVIINEIAKQDIRIHWIQRQLLPKGASACRNIGIENAKGDYLIFLDADDILAPYCLENRLRNMNENPKIDFGVFKMGVFNNQIEDSTRDVNLFSLNSDVYLTMFLSYQLPWAITCGFWKQTFIKQNNIRFSEQYQRLQDPEFHCKILMKYHPEFKVFDNSETDCYYRQPQTKNKPVNEVSLLKTTQSILLFYTEMHQLIANQKHDKYLDTFVVNIFHSLLFYTKLTTTNPIIDLYRQMNKIRPINNISLNSIRLFATFNKLRLTFVKGAGVSKLWNAFNNQPQSHLY